VLGGAGDSANERSAALLEAAPTGRGDWEVVLFADTMTAFHRV
jgi:hypothetical protein